MLCSEECRDMAHSVWFSEPFSPSGLSSDILYHTVLLYKIIAIYSSYMYTHTHTHTHILLLLFSHPGMSDSLWPHGLQHARPPCPSPPGLYLTLKNFFLSVPFSSRWSHRWAWSFSSCGEQGILYSWPVRASHCAGFSCFRAQVLGHRLQ